MATDAAGIDQVRLLELVADTSLLGEITIRQVNIGEQCFGPFVDLQPHHAHLRRIPEPMALVLNLVLLVAAVNEIMTRFAQGDQIVRPISPGFARFDVMDVQDPVFRLSLAPLASMVVRSRTDFFFSLTKWLHHDRSIA